MSFADLPPGTHAETVRNHWWWRPGWRVGRRFYAFHVTLADKPELTAIAAEYRTVLADLPGLTLIPDQWLHLTMQGVGFTDEVTPAEVGKVIDAVHDVLGELKPFWVTFTDAVVADEAIVLPVQPKEPVKQVRAAIRAAIGRVSGQVRLLEHPDKFRPHASVAYLTATGSADPYITRITSANISNVGIVIDSIDLIEMHRDQEMYEWKPLANFALTAEA